MSVVHPAVQLTLVLALLLWGSVAQAQQRVNTADPTAKGLVAWYYAPPGLGWGPRWYDLLGRFHGLLTNGASWAPSTRQGGRYEVRFDGTNDYVTVAANAGLEPPVRTVTFRMKATAGGGGYQSLVANQHDTDYFNIFYRPSTSNTLAIYFKTTAGDNALDTGNAGPIVAGVWTHIGVIGGAGTIATYVNCVLHESGSFAGTLVASGTALLLGAKGATPGSPYGGALDDVRIYDRILTAQELCTVMRQPPPLALAPSLAVLPPPPLAQGSLLPFFPTTGQ